MADNESVQDAPDTSVDESVDTSTNEEAQDTDVDLEDDNTSFDDGDETEESEDSESEEQDTEPADQEEESEDDGEQEETQEQPEESETPDQDSREEDTISQEEQKRRNDEYARRRIAEKKAREDAKRQAQEEYLQQAEDEKDLALRQLQVDAYNNKVEFNQSKLQSGIDKAVASIDLFREGSPEVKEFLFNSVDDFEARYVSYDQNGDPISVEGDVYQYLQRKADEARRLAGVGARENSKQRNSAKTRAMTPPSKTPKQPKVDPDLEAFDEEASRW